MNKTDRIYWIWFLGIRFILFYVLTIALILIVSPNFTLSFLNGETLAVYLANRLIIVITIIIGFLIGETLYILATKPKEEKKNE